MDLEVKIIDEIANLIKDNIQLLFLYRDDCLIKFKEYCRDKEDVNEITPSDKLIEFTDEALTDLMDVFLYDLRDIE